MSQLDPEALEARLSAIASDMTDEDQVLHDPPADLWGRISVAVDAERPTAPVVTLDSRRSPWVKVVSIAAAVVVVAGVGAVILGNRDAQPSPQVVASATLGRLEATQGEGSATLVRKGSALHLELTTTDMATPPAGADYELWLIDSKVTNPRSLGELKGKVTGHNTIDVVVPPNIDPKQYPVVDISVEPTDGNHKHSGHSVMRGTLA